MDLRPIRRDGFLHSRTGPNRHRPEDRFRVLRHRCRVHHSVPHPVETPAIHVPQTHRRLRKNLTTHCNRPQKRRAEGRAVALPTRRRWKGDQVASAQCMDNKTSVPF